tara:strand:- start:1645 stop:2079 length:435 start_codon:yes stop_codon:yes gene_type:complete
LSPEGRHFRLDLHRLHQAHLLEQISPEENSGSHDPRYLPEERSRPRRRISFKTFFRKKPRSVGGAFCDPWNLHSTLGEDAHSSPVFRPFYVELYLSLSKSEECVIFSKAHVHSGMECRTTLTDNNIAGTHYFAGIAFYAKPFGL